jgi:hypothetical protein
MPKRREAPTSKLRTSREHPIARSRYDAKPMAESKLPYLNAYGNITKALERIKSAATPPRFSQDFLETTLGMTGGGARPVLPFLKRTGFLGPDGTPTELYKEFRNPALAGAAAAKALKIGYAPIYAMDEEAHKLERSKLKGLVVQATGSDANAPSVQAIVKSFEALNAFADFAVAAAPVETPETLDETPEMPNTGQMIGGLNLGYTINLHLPSTSDVGVYNAIFRSLRDNLLRDLE